MKKLSIIFLAFVGIFFMYSCEDDEVGPVIDPNPDAPTITAPSGGESYMLTEENADSVIVTLEWTEPDYGFPAATSYSVQMAETGTDFAEPTNLGSTDTTMFEIEGGNLNNKLLTAGYPAGEPVSIDFRVIANVVDSVENLLSGAVSLEFTPYQVNITYPKIYVPGAYQGWDPGTAPPVYSVEGNDIYSGFVLFGQADNAFKFTLERSWDTNWGDEAAAGSEPGDGTLEAGGVGNDIYAADSGYYYLKANINDLTYEGYKTAWSISGSATGGSAVDLNFNVSDTTWSATVDLSAGDFKFQSLGSPAMVAGADAKDFIYGLDSGNDLMMEGDPIPVESGGNYTITLNMKKPPFEFELEAN